MKDGDNHWEPAPSIVPVISFPGSTPDFVDHLACDAGTDTNGQCFVIINNSEPGEFQVYAATIVTIRSRTVPVETDGTGDNSEDAKKIYEAAIDASRTDTYSWFYTIKNTVTISLANLRLYAGDGVAVDCGGQKTLGLSQSLTYKAKSNSFDHHTSVA